MSTFETLAGDSTPAVEPIPSSYDKFGFRRI